MDYKKSFKERYGSPIAEPKSEEYFRGKGYVYFRYGVDGGDVIPKDKFIKLPEVIQKTPDYVLINQTGSYAFAYDLTGSDGTVVSGVLRNIYHTGSVIYEKTAVGVVNPVKIEIQPSAWRSCDHAGAQGEVTFVYRGR